MLARPLQVLRWLDYVLFSPGFEPTAPAQPARITVHPAIVGREEESAGPPALADCVPDHDGIQRARLAWLRAMEAHVRAGQNHSAAAAVHARLGHPDRAALESERAAIERAQHEAALAKHPEWAADAAAWPEHELNAPPG